MAPRLLPASKGDKDGWTRRGTSWSSEDRGAISVLRRLVAALPIDLPAAMLVVVHTGSHSSILPQLLTACGTLKAVHAHDGDELERGKIYVASPDWHMTVTVRAIRLNQHARENFARPAIDPLFRSAAVAHGPRVVCVVLSGDLHDGSSGMVTLKRNGGFAILQDAKDCEAPSMPGAALSAAGADIVCGADAICHYLARAVCPNRGSVEKMDFRGH